MKYGLAIRNMFSGKRQARAGKRMVMAKKRKVTNEWAEMPTC